VQATRKGNRHPVEGFCKHSIERLTKIIVIRKVSSMWIFGNVTYLCKYYNYFYIFVPVVCIFCYASGSIVYAHQEKPSVTITDVGSFTDAMGIKNIVGTVENNNDIPIETAIAINATTCDAKAAPVS
jgi:hypothetical protein